VRTAPSSNAIVGLLRVGYEKLLIRSLIGSNCLCEVES